MPIEIRWHGRGGQGAVTAAEIIASAAIIEGKWAQAFPSFGAERRGAPVQAYTRINDKPIYNRSFIYEPDVVVVLDQGLLSAGGKDDVVAGLKPNGKLVVNSNQKPSDIAKRLGFEGKVITVDATSIAIEIIGAPIVNTSMIGAVIKAIDAVSIDNVVKVLENRFPPALATKNVKAMVKAFEEAIIGGL